MVHLIIKTILYEALPSFLAMATSDSAVFTIDV